MWREESDSAALIKMECKRSANGEAGSEAAAISTHSLIREQVCLPAANTEAGGEMERHIQRDTFSKRKDHRE